MESGINCWLGIDDMVFIFFLTLQHNINKWICVYRILKDSVNVDGDSVDWKALLKNKEMKKHWKKSLVLSSNMAPVFLVRMHRNATLLSPNTLTSFTSK
jgi:hypothetical protein